jgi:hypothetical protein
MEIKGGTTTSSRIKGRAWPCKVNAGTSTSSLPKIERRGGRRATRLFRNSARQRPWLEVPTGTCTANRLPLLGGRAHRLSLRRRKRHTAVRASLGEDTAGSGRGILVLRNSWYHPGADDLRHSTGEVSMIQDDAGAQEINVYPEPHAAGPSFLSIP